MKHVLRLTIRSIWRENRVGTMTYNCVQDAWLHLEKTQNQHLVTQKDAQLVDQSEGATAVKEILRITFGSERSQNWEAKT